MAFLGFAFLTFFFTACSGGGSGSSSSNSANIATEKECSIDNGTGKQTRTVNEGEEPGGWGTCILASCDNGYTKNNGACHKSKACTPDEVAASSPHGATGGRIYQPSTSDYGHCILTSCVDDYTLGGDGACYETNKDCTPQEVTDVDSNGEAGTRAYTGTGYATCVLTSCANTYTLDNGACHETTEDCSGDIANSASATKTYTQGSGYDSCTLDSCQTGYVKTGNSCRKPRRNKYAAANGDERSCTGATITNVLKLGGQAEEVTNSAQCPFTCQVGYIINTSNTSNRSCDVPNSGKYANANGREANCTGSITNVLQLGGQAEQVTNSAQCPFTCQNGHLKNDSARTCVSQSLIATGSSHTCAILDDNSVKCWGDNEAGPAGSGEY